jgi:hypothetical protein
MALRYAAAGRAAQSHIETDRLCGVTSALNQVQRSEAAAALLRQSTSHFELVLSGNIKRSCRLRSLHNEQNGFNDDSL